MICEKPHLFIERFKDQTCTVSGDAVVGHNILFHPVADVFILVVIFGSQRRRRTCEDEETMVDMTVTEFNSTMNRICVAPFFFFD